MVVKKSSAEDRFLPKNKKEKKIWLEGFKAGLDAKSCCCNRCTLHSIAVEEKTVKDCVGDLFGEET